MFRRRDDRKKVQVSGLGEKSGGKWSLQVHMVKDRGNPSIDYDYQSLVRNGSFADCQREYRSFRLEPGWHFTAARANCTDGSFHDFLTGEIGNY